MRTRWTSGKKRWGANYTGIAARITGTYFAFDPARPRIRCREQVSANLRLFCAPSFAIERLRQTPYSIARVNARLPIGSASSAASPTPRGHAKSGSPLPNIRVSPWVNAIPAARSGLRFRR
jgi:hypothetical protein